MRDAGRETGRTQHVTFVVRGGYSPQRIQASAGVPLRITFERREARTAPAASSSPTSASTMRCPPINEPLSSSRRPGQAATVLVRDEHGARHDRGQRRREHAAATARGRRGGHHHHRGPDRQ